jgi:hypothetical protein
MTIARLQQRRGTTTEWEDPAANPILAAGEIGVDLTTGQFRIGNGTSRWTSLVPFYPGVSSGSSGGGSGAAPALVVAAPNSPPAVKARADVVCTTGTDHAATINAAIDRGEQPDPQRRRHQVRRRRARGRQLHAQHADPDPVARVLTPRPGHEHRFS